MGSLTEQLSVHDPRDRLVEQLRALDATILSAKARQRSSGREVYADPDSTAVLKALEMGAKLIADYHARALSSVESIGTLDRAQAIAELKAVLAAWEDPAVSDEQWVASRTAGLSPPEAKPRSGVVRGRKPR